LISEGIKTTPLGKLEIANLIKFTEIMRAKQGRKSDIHAAFSVQIARFSREGGFFVGKLGY
jgi:hypothetical protein